MAAPIEYRGSPPATSPTNPNPSEFAMPPAKRQRTSNWSSPPPHVSPYGNPASNGAPSPPIYGQQNGASTGQRYSMPPSPHFSNAPQPQTYSTPYSNGNMPAPSSNMTQQQQYMNANSSVQFTPQQTYPPAQNAHLQNQFASHQNSYNPAVQSHPINMAVAGSMGPPMKPAEKPSGNDDNPDQTDVLHGSGVDLREEEANLQKYYSQTPNSSQDNQKFGPALDSAYYGGVSQTAEPTDGKTPEEWAILAAEDAWQTAARDLAASRQEELGAPFSLPNFMMRKMERIAKEVGVRLNTTETGSMGRLTIPRIDYPVKIDIRTAPAAAEEAFMLGTGVLIPQNTLLVDQIIVLSLAAKQHIRQLLEGAVSIAKGRQTGSMGTVPAEWADLAVSVNTADGTIVSMDPEAARPGWESAISPRTTNPLKRSRSAANRLPTPISDGTNTPIPPKTNFANDLAKALRDQAENERQYEEDRLRKRMKRNDGTSVNGSAAPGTPGSVNSSGATAIKAPTRKEIEKKTKEKKKEDAASNASANATSSMFLGLPKKGKRQYSWLTTAKTGGNAASYTGIAGGSSARASSSAAVPEAPVELTQRGQIRMGSWREDTARGEGVQLRDWVAVLEKEGNHIKEWQRSLMNLENPTARREITESE